jgi:hypothetical protein
MPQGFSFLAGPRRRLTPTENSILVGFIVTLPCTTASLRAIHVCATFHIGKRTLMGCGVWSSISTLCTNGIPPSLTVTLIGTPTALVMEAPISATQASGGVSILVAL